MLLTIYCEPKQTTCYLIKLSTYIKDKGSGENGRKKRKKKKLGPFAIKFFMIHAEFEIHYESMQLSRKPQLLLFQPSKSTRDGLYLTSFLEIEA